MPYSNEILTQAKDRLSQRRQRALADAEALRRQAYLKLPRLAEIDRELGAIGASAARSVIKSGSAVESIEQLAERSLALQEEYNGILRSMGLESDALEPKFTCKKCSDTGYIEQNNRTVICECLEKLMSDIACEKLNADSPLSLCTFDSFDLSYYSDTPDSSGNSPLSRMTKIYHYCRRYADGFSASSRGLLMRGATGLGKTHLSLAIANEVMRKGYSVVYVSAPDILSRLERDHFSYRYDEEDSTFRSLTKCDLLIIDDLGTEFSSQYTVATVYNLFNTRILTGKPIIMNTNLTLNELLEHYSQRFMSRLLGACDKLDFIGEDIRPRL